MQSFFCVNSTNKKVDNLKIKKASPISGIPAKIIEDNFDVVASHLLDLFIISLDGNFFQMN